MGSLRGTAGDEPQRQDPDPVTGPSCTCVWGRGPLQDPCSASPVSHDLRPVRVQRRQTEPPNPLTPCPSFRGWRWDHLAPRPCLPANPHLDTLYFPSLLPCQHPPPRPGWAPGPTATGCDSARRLPPFGAAVTLTQSQGSAWEREPEPDRHTESARSSQGPRAVAQAPALHGAPCCTPQDLTHPGTRIWGAVRWACARDPSRQAGPSALLRPPWEGGGPL